MNGNHWTGSEYVRVNYCLDCTSRIVRKASTRKPRTVRPLYGDFATVASLVGYRTDGSGKRVR